MEVLASWDDGSTADLKMAELMAHYKIPTIFYWPSMLSKGKKTSSSLTEQDCKEISKNFTIGSHSASGQSMKKMTIPQLSMEITDSKKNLQDLTGQEIESFAYPKKSISSLTKALVKGAGYKSARTNIVGHLKPGDDSFAIQCTVQIGIDRIEYKNKCWEYFADDMLSKIQPNETFHLFGNSWEVELYKDWSALEKLLIKLKSIF
jgi:peptidoglycan/xylan/chitin deacetylase (PgdA/CDA1 family)